MANRLKIFFIGHDSSITGAPILLFNLVELLSSINIYDISVVLYRGGPIEDKFRAIAPLHVIKPATYAKTKSFFRRVINYLTYRVKFVSVLKELETADVIFNNTVANGELLKKIERSNIPVISYVHELESIIKYYNKNEAANLTFKISDLLLYPSAAVKSNLISNHKIVPHELKYFPYYFKKLNDINTNTLEDFKKELFLSKSIPNKKFLVVGMGTATHRKGIDLFLSTCESCLKRSADIGFVWVGDFEDEEMRIRIKERIKTNRLNNSFVITGQIPHAEYNLSPFDILFLSSREDPYPLVVLEAALLKIPSLYFKETGGIGEFVSPDAGWCIDKFDVEQAAAKILWLSKHKEEVILKGNSAYNKVHNLHSDPDMIVERFAEVIEKIKLEICL